MSISFGAHIHVAANMTTMAVTVTRPWHSGRAALCKSACYLCHCRFSLDCRQLKGIPWGVGCTKMRNPNGIPLISMSHFVSGGKWGKCICAPAWMLMQAQSFNKPFVGMTTVEADFQISSTLIFAAKEVPSSIRFDCLLLLLVPNENSHSCVRVRQSACNHDRNIKQIPTITIWWRHRFSYITFTVWFICDVLLI